MYKYRCYLLEKTGRLADTKVFTAPDDRDAASYAFALFVRASTEFDRFEVWRQGALVHAFGRDEMQIHAGQRSREIAQNAPDVSESHRPNLDAGGTSQPIAATSALKVSTEPRVWVAALRGLAIAFALTLSWIFLFDSGFFKTISVASAQLPNQKQLSQLP
jgi:hypothetical protein